MDKSTPHPLPRITTPGDQSSSCEDSGRGERLEVTPDEGGMDAGSEGRVCSPANSADDPGLPNEWLDRTISLWQKYSGEQLTREDAERITLSGLRLIEGLLEDSAR